MIIVWCVLRQEQRGGQVLCRRWSTPEERQRWTWNRAHGRQRQGGAPEVSRTNMRALQAILLHCPCGAFAQYSAALRAAKAADRDEVIPGDGCAAPAHRAKPRNRLRFAATQAR